MFKLYYILIFLLILSIKRASSIHCLQCYSDNYTDSECDDGNESGTLRGPCRWEDGMKVSFCYKMVGKGAKTDKPITLRGCWDGENIKPYKNYSKDQPFNHRSFPSYNVYGSLYTCEADYCNSSNNLKGHLLASVLILSLFWLTKSFNLFKFYKFKNRNDF